MPVAEITAPFTPERSQVRTLPRPPSPTRSNARATRSAPACRDTVHDTNVPSFGSCPVLGQAESGPAAASTGSPAVPIASVSTEVPTPSADGVKTSSSSSRRALARRPRPRPHARMPNEVDERRNPRTSATVNQLLDRYLEMIDVSSSTRVMYTRYLENHVRPFIGGLNAGAVDPDVLDSLYAELRRCRIHCRRTAADRPSDPAAARVRRALPSARVQAVVEHHDSPHPPPAERRLQAGSALAVGGDESGGSG